MNSLTYAYLGDAIYEVYVRKHLLQKNIVKGKLLQKEAVLYVSAKAQCKVLKQLIEENYFTEEEQNLLRHFRNYKLDRHPKNTDLMEYKYATSLEAIIGYWEIEKQKEKINQLMTKIFENIECTKEENRK